MHSARVAAALLGLVVLTACGSDEPAAGPPPPPPSSAAAPSPTASPTPSAASEQQAVEQAVRFYYDGFNRASATGDAQELARGSAPDCPCRRKVELTAQLLERGRVEGNVVTVSSVRVVELEGSIAVAQAEYTASDGRLLGPDGSVLEQLQGEPATSRTLELEKGPQGWLVTQEVKLGGR